MTSRARLRMIRITIPVLIAACLLATPQTSRAQVQEHNAGHGSMADEGKLNVAVWLYDGALLLDYGIAAEMFLAADFMRAFHVYTVAHERDVTLSIVGAMHADYAAADAPLPDVLIVPGGPTWRQNGSRPETAAYFAKVLDHGGTLFSICTGAMLLGTAGVLDGHTVTTNHAAAPMLQQMVPEATVVTDQPFVDDGAVVTSAGAGTAIEATLHMVERLTNAKIARDLGERYLDYPHLEE